MQSDWIVVVSGLPRSGTSMMMQMLKAGGLPLLADGLRPADRSNPRGYYEYEPVKRLARDTAWVGAAAGKAVKIVSPLLQHLPGGFVYKVIFMERAMAEILASQRAMLESLGSAGSTGGEDAVLAERFADHLGQVKTWLAAQAHVTVLYVDYDEAVAGDARRLARAVRDFVGVEMDTEAMGAVLDLGLYRQRGGTPAPGACASDRATSDSD